LHCCPPHIPLWGFDEPLTRKHHTSHLLPEDFCGSVAAPAAATVAGEDDEVAGEDDEDEDDLVAGEDDEVEDEVDIEPPSAHAAASRPTFYCGYDSEIHMGWRCEHGRPPCEKEFTNEFRYDDGVADEDRVTCVFKDGSALVLAALTVGMMNARAATVKPRSPGTYWSSDDGEWSVRVKADRSRLAFLKGPGTSSQICQVKVNQCPDEDQACELIKTIAQELIAKTLNNTKDAIYNRRNELLEAFPGTAMKRPAAALPSVTTKGSETPLAGDADDAAPITPPAKRLQAAKAAAKAVVPAVLPGYGFSLDDLAGFDEATAYML
jgi:hypothetical protein